MTAATIAAGIGIVPMAPVPQAQAGILRNEASASACVYSNHDLGLHADFENLVGRPINCAVVFNDTSSNWTDWAQPWFARDGRQPYRWAEWVATGPEQRRLIISQSLVPSTAPADWRARGAAGQYDAHAKKLAEYLVAKGLGNSVIRLSHEMNGDWYYSGIGNTAKEWRDWTAYWRRVVTAMRKVPGANFSFDWCVNSGYRAIDLNSYYPGDNFVDIIGIDQYDSYVEPSPMTPQARWDILISRKSALQALADFATAHGKPLSIPEYGLIDASRPNGAGDNDVYMTNLAQFIASRNVAYHSYFNKNVNGVLRLEQTPKSLAAWRRAFSPATQTTQTTQTTADTLTASGQNTWSALVKARRDWVVRTVTKKATAKVSASSRGRTAPAVATAALRPVR